MAQRQVSRRFLLAATGLLPLIAACGGDDFQYKISGDRGETDQRVISGEGSGTTMSHEDLLRLQEEYAKKAQAAEAAKGAAGG